MAADNLAQQTQAQQSQAQQAPAQNRRVQESSAQESKIKVILLDTLGYFAGWATQVYATGRKWDILRVDNANSMASFLREARYDVVVIASSVRFDADQLSFKKVMAVQPHAVRILLSSMAVSTAQISRSLELVHRVFSDQSPIEEIAETIEYLVKVTKVINKPKTKEFIASLGTLPSPPTVYRELSDALQATHSSAEQISAVIERDPALAAQVLKVVNSAYFGLTRQVTNLKEAVTMLGVRMLRGLSLSGHLASLYPQDEQWSSFSFEQMGQRALLVARLAQQICKDMKANQAVQDQAFIGGLLHDLGILIMASHEPDRYRKLMTLAAQKQLSIYVVEKKYLGFFHGETGAYLLGLWNLPPQVIEAVLLHHTPQVSIGSEFKPLTAVHIADALIAPLQNELGCDLSTKLSREYVDRVGVFSELHRWRTAASQLQRLTAPGP